MTELVAHLERELRRVFGGKKWISVHEVLVGAGSVARQLQKLGATEAMCVAVSRGAGELPDPDFAPQQLLVQSSGRGALASLDALAAARPDIRAKVDAFDPDGSVRVIGPIFDDGRDFAGRRKFGARPPAWQQLEDKTRIDAIWDAAGVTRSPSRVVELSDETALESTSNKLDQGDGVVWAADAKSGYHGGAMLTRWIPNSDVRASVRAEFAERADSVRVMPFLEGVPCSIHGIVFDDYVIAIRPCEMVVLRRPDHSFQYARAATLWDPKPADREEMRQIAKRVGAHLRENAGYRGAFTIDGVMTVDGFRPTELNPRYGAALTILAEGLGVELKVLNLAVIEGCEADWRPQELEELLIARADANRSASANMRVDKQVTEPEQVKLAFADGRFHAARDAEPIAAEVELGPLAEGSIIFAHFTASRFEHGRPFAPIAAELFRWADEHWSLGIGPLTPAAEVR